MPVGISPDSPDGLAAGQPLGALHQINSENLHSRRRVHFAFTRCIHRDWTLPTGINYWPIYEIWRAEQDVRRSIQGIRIKIGQSHMSAISLPLSSARADGTQPIKQLSSIPHLGGVD